MHKPEIEANLAIGMLRRAQLNPERTALIFEEQTFSYGDFAQGVRRQASLLQDSGVCMGDRVAFVGFNQPAFLETLFAANALGAIFVPLNFRLTGEELKFIINDAGAHTLVCDGPMQEVLDPVKDELCCRAYFGAESNLAGWRSLSDEGAACAPLQNPVSAGQHDTSVIMYTSGTTGLPKGVMLSHGNIMWNNINAQLSYGGARDDVVLTAAPLFHIAGLNVMTLQSFIMGSTVVLLRNFDPAVVLEYMQRYKVTSMFGAPAMFLFMSQHPDFDNTDLSSIKMLVCGAAPVPESLLSLYAQREINFCQGYGLTETSPFASLLTPEWAISKLGSAGQAAFYSALKIVNDDNQELAIGEHGEICISGPNVMKGYWNRPEATAKAIDDKGWFHSGDIGYMDEDGFLFICDRLKDMVITGGENVYPAEVESVLYKHELIAEVAVIGLPDEKWGEAVTAVIVLVKGADLSLEELRIFAESQLARYKLPVKLHKIPVLPRNPAGKVLKFVLKEALSGKL
ncbi:MAG: fatty-acyl-CoA synthase [Paraglaciecola sp.]|jgi:fatty-acyl-CoA synthase